MLLRGTLRAYYIKCGKPNCACGRDHDKRHGPYWYLVWQQYGKLRRSYVPKEQLAQVRASVEARQAVVGKVRKLRVEVDIRCGATRQYTCR